MIDTKTNEVIIKDINNDILHKESFIDKKIE